jgi:glycerophosphoryl diester phosphodiesterase
MILQGGRLDSVLFFFGYWRYGINSETGLINFHISSFEGGSKIVSGDSSGLKIAIRGSYGEGDNLPGNPFKLEYLRPFSEEVRQKNFYILAHRGGGRNSDYLQASENSIEIIQLAERLGANGIELDVQLTKDGVPVIYHDPDINLRLTQKSVIWGNIEDFTFAQLRTFVKLKNGENLPSLREALETVINKTGLRFVWLDLKSLQNEIPYVIKVIKELNIKERDLEIVLGIPTNEKFEDLYNIQKSIKISSLCELEVEYVRALDSRVWAPRWTQGLQTELVREMHSEGRLTFSWTLDEPAFIQKYISEGEFDGILTNHPTLVAYHYYLK